MRLVKEHGHRSASLLVIGTVPSEYPIAISIIDIIFAVQGRSIGPHFATKQLHYVRRELEPFDPHEPALCSILASPLQDVRALVEIEASCQWAPWTSAR